MKQDIEPPDLVGRFRDRPLEFQPGERMKYSNSGYHLLGLIIEKASGKSYASFLQERIWKPLGMSHSGYGDDPRLPRVKGYEVVGKIVPARPAPIINMKIPYSAGALVSSVDDLALWDAAIREGKLLKKESWQAVFSPGRLKDGSRTSYAYGWAIGKVDGRPAQSHSGGIPGFASHLLRLPEEKLLVVVLFNGLPPPIDAGALAHRLALTALGKPYVEPKVARIDPALLDRYVGVYRASAAGAMPLFIRRNGDHLTLQAQGGPRLDAWPESETRFFVKDRLTRLSFVVERGAGPARAVNLTKSNGDAEQVVRTAEKLPP
jgi:CubicO group peptidase (beta-lactamase class C family)